MQSNRYAVQASASIAGAPQAAVIGIAVTEDFEILFDTLDSSRKAHNLRGNPRVALVLGGCNPGDERTVQYEGVAEFPQGEELRLAQRAYFGTFADGPSRLSWEGIAYVRVKPRWLRYSDFNSRPPVVVEIGFDIK